VAQAIRIRDPEVGGQESRSPASPVFGALTIDVEDYFQVEAFANVIDRGDWEKHEPRVARNTQRLLDLLADTSVVGTFFVLGWVAKRNSELIRRIVSEGHELASHGLEHHRADRQSVDEFRSDIRRSKALLEDIGGVPVVGYRAPTFSVGRTNLWAHAVLAEEGYRYSSSVYPIEHDLYGEPRAPRRPFHPIEGFLEIPLTTARICGRNLPSAGGGYFRLCPYAMTRQALRKAHSQLNSPCVFYVHPWEIDPGQPRLRSASTLSQFRHYLNLGRTEGRLRRLLRDFRWGRMDQTFLDGMTTLPPLIAAWPTHH
jgi:polysaccharide deacetylase family protein (PEP-CTERM system associated)